MIYLVLLLLRVLCYLFYSGGSSVAPPCYHSRATVRVSCLCWLCFSRVFFFQFYFLVRDRETQVFVLLQDYGSTLLCC